MSDLEFLPSLRDSETITCKRCNPRQFPRSGRCIKCGRPLELNYVTLRIDALLNPDSKPAKEHLARVIGTLLRRFRKRRGVSQSQLVTRAAGCITRTSLSKAECVHMLPPLYKFLALARALGLTAVILRFDGTANGHAGESTKDR